MTKTQTVISFLIEIYDNSCGTYFTELTMLNDKLYAFCGISAIMCVTDFYRKYCCSEIMSFQCCC